MRGPTLLEACSLCVIFIFLIGPLPWPWRHSLKMDIFYNPKVLTPAAVNSQPLCVARAFWLRSRLTSSLVKFWLTIAQSFMGKASRISLTPDPAETPLAFETGSGLKGGGPVWAIPLQNVRWRDVLQSDTTTHTISRACATTGQSAFLPRWDLFYLYANTGGFQCSL